MIVASYTPTLTERLSNCQSQLFSLSFPVFSKNTHWQWHRSSGHRHQVGTAPLPCMQTQLHLQGGSFFLCPAPSLLSHWGGQQLLSAVCAGEKAALPLEQSRWGLALLSLGHIWSGACSNRPNRCLCVCAQIWARLSSVTATLLCCLWLQELMCLYCSSPEGKLGSAEPLTFWKH